MLYRRKLSLQALVVILCTILAPLADTRSVFAEEKVGVLASYVGEWGAYGQAYRNGINMAGVGSGTTFIYEEDGFLPAKSVAAFRKLVQHDKISAVLVGDNVTAQAVSPLALKLKMPLFVWASTDKTFTNNPYALRLWTSTDKDFDFVAAEAQRRGYRRLALFTSTHNYSILWAQALQAHFPGSQWIDFSTPPDSFSTALLKAKSAGLDAVGVCLSAGMNGRLARQMRDLHIDLPLFGCNFLESEADIRGAAGAFDNVWFTAPRLAQDFTDRYRQRFGSTDHVVSAAVFHDAALLMTKTTTKPFAIAGVREVNTSGDRHLDFEYQVITFRGSEMVAP